MRENKLLITILMSIMILFVALVSCEGKVRVSHATDVRFSTEIGRKASADSGWEPNDEVGIYMVNHGTLADSATTERANQPYKADIASRTSGFTPVDVSHPLKWDDLSTNPAPFFDFIAYYPYASSINDTTALPINVYPAGTGEQDPGTADFLWGHSKTVSTYAGGVQNNTSTVRLKLDHALSRLIVNLGPSTTVDATAINAATGGCTVTVTGTSTQATINLDTGAVSVPGNGMPIRMKDISADTLTATERAAGKRQFEGVLIPTAHSTALLNALDLEFVLTDGSGTDTAYTWKATSVADKDKHLIHFDAGKQHIYTMTLNTSDDVVAVAAIEIGIEDWDTGDSINTDALKVYCLSFDGNNATSGTAPGKMYAHAGSPVTVPGSGTLDKTGHYYFGGWNTTSDGTGVRYSAGDSFTMPAHDVTLYAQWLVKVKTVSAGGSSTMILKKDGSLWATGRNEWGQLGDGTTTNRTTPVRVKASADYNDFMTDVKEVSIGTNHTMILKTDGTLWAAGYNNSGQLGVGDNDNRRTPVQVMTDVEAVSAGGSHTIILKKDGTLWATGYNWFGQLGLGISGYGTEKKTPMQVKASIAPDDFMTDVKEVSAGGDHTMLLKKDDTLWATGYNYYGELGLDNSGSGTTKNTPVQVTSMNTEPSNPVTAFSAGGHHTMILKKNGTLWATGRNIYGQLGDGTTTEKTTPVQVKASTADNDFMTDVAAVSAGYHHTMIVKKDGTLWATGSNGNGELGVGDNTDRSTPVQVKSSGGVGFMTDVAAVSAGIYHTLILKKDGTLWATGRNNYGQLGDGTTTNTNTPVQVVF
ncbi:fimbrillin family protein [Parasphaerochaeta coccoides]|uniref:Listeria/Bacterioides repeat-containing protein n=1 Tax=Parasphaerochaeta coccoides (strain ATCC BAA-1237 / DSM 17374 / SPN1) TaxID=760011 RepID=F4GIZ9_PARC1|nr:fimbrillin family protein [Parasphaerochaeta coccoides]AEC01294.1 Listeria/Bacterioides repeat-containing protein [Parasphaerochaeta coccoides DSM 17374]